MFANLREQPATIAFFDSLVVEDHESNIGLGEDPMTQVSVGTLANQLPRPPDGSAYEVHQRFVIREQQHRCREKAVQIGVHSQSNAVLGSWH